MEESEETLDFNFSLPNYPPSLISVTPFSNSIATPSRRLSSCFSQPNRPVVPAARKLAWVSLQGRLIGAEEATSSRAIGGNLSRDEALCWELFSPIHRILIVAVVAVAAGESKKNREIRRLRKSVEIRDQVLSRMQLKLDNLCEQVHNIKDQQGSISFVKNMEVGDDCGCLHCDKHQDSTSGTMGNSVEKHTRGNEALQCKLLLRCEVEPEERRMSDISDWASSVTSLAEIQMNTLAIEQDVNYFKRDSEEKDAPSFVHPTDVLGSKRTAELESIIRRKNMIITKLKKDMIVLETKVQHYTRIKRQSFSATSVSSDTKKSPLMADNLLYDMDNTTSPSSSDSDCSSKTRTPAPSAKPQKIATQHSEPAFKQSQKSEPIRPRSSSMKQTEMHLKSRPVTPLREKSMNQKCVSASASSSSSSLRPKQLSVGGDDQRKSKRHTQTGSKDASLPKRWA